MITYTEEQKLRFRIRQLEDAVVGLRTKLDRANSHMAEHKIGPYKYTETKETRFQKQVDAACARIKLAGELAAERIRIAYSDHEYYEHKLNDGQILIITHGILFEQYKNKDKHDKNIHTRNRTTHI